MRKDRRGSASDGRFVAMESGGRSGKLPPRGAKVFIERLATRAIMTHARTIGEIFKKMLCQIEDNLKSGMSRQESFRAVFKPVIGQRLLTGFPSIDALAQPDFRRGLSVTGDARYDVLHQIAVQWMNSGLPVVPFTDLLDQQGQIVLLDLELEEPANGLLLRLRKQYRDRAGLVLIGDDEITDPMFDEMSAMTIKFDYVPDENGNSAREIEWLITYLRDGPQATGRLRLNDDKRWVEQPDSVKQTGRYFMI